MMENTDLQKILDEMNGNEELRQKYREAATVEEKNALLARITGLQPEDTQKLDEIELETVNGGALQPNIRCMATCSNCSWNSPIGNNPEIAYALGIEHINSTGCSSFHVYPI